MSRRDYLTVADVLTIHAVLIYAELMNLFDKGSFDLAHLEPWLRGFVTHVE